MRVSRWLGSLRLAWERARSSLWYLPALLVAGAVALSFALLHLDRRIAHEELGFGGNAEAARTILATIAGSLISVLAVAFSVTMLALQQAATQYTPRALRNFTRDRGNQLVLGVYCATFCYALLVMRAVRGPHEDAAPFVPSLSITTGMALSLVSLGLLIYFIHHASESLQVSNLMRAVRGELDAELERLFPEPLRRAEDDCEEAPARGRELVVRADVEGYLREVRPGSLARAARGRMSYLRVEVAVGAFVRRGDVLLRAWSEGGRSEDAVEALRAAFQLDRERSVHEDPLFGIAQLVDIALKALSPGISDPSTAEQAIDHLGGALGLLLERAIPSPLRALDGGVRVRFRVPAFGDYVEASVAQIRRAARADLHVSLHLAHVLRTLERAASDPTRAAHLRHQVEEVFAGFDEACLTDHERERLRHARREAGWYPRAA